MITYNDICKRIPCIVNYWYCWFMRDDLVKIDPHGIGGFRDYKGGILETGCKNNLIMIMVKDVSCLKLHIMLTLLFGLGTTLALLHGLSLSPEGHN